MLIAFNRSWQEGGDNDGQPATLVENGGNGGGITNMAQVIGGSTQAPALAGNIYYYPWSGTYSGNATESLVEQPLSLPFSHGAYITNFAVFHGTASGAGTNVIYTIWTNGVASLCGMKETGNGVNQVFTSTNTTGLLTNLSRVTIKMDNSSGGFAAQQVSWSFQLVPY